MPWAVIASVAGPILGSVISGNANKKAAETASNAEIEAARLRNEGIDKQIAALRQGIAEGDTLYGGIREQTQPGVSYLHGVMGSPMTLTPEQQMALTDLRRRVENSQNVAGSALRGSGRSFVDAMREIESDFVNRALGANRDRADRAALEFARPNFNAASSQAAAHATLGQNVGQAVANQGANTGNATVNAGYNQANAGTANANIWGSSLRDITGVISQELKDQTRPTKYAPLPTPASSANDDPYGLNR